MQPLPPDLKRQLEAERQSKITKELLAAAIQAPCFTPPDKPEIVIPETFTKRDLKKFYKLRKLCKGMKTDQDIIASILKTKEDENNLN